MQIKNTTPEQMAEKLAEFIKFNQIDVNRFSFDEILQKYFEAQIATYDNMTANDIKQLI